MKGNGSTAAAFVQSVADRLKARRLQLDWSLTDVQRHGGPTYHTVQKVEDGHLAAPAVMEKHITALGLNLRDVYVAALMPPGCEPLYPLLSREAIDVARVYDHTIPLGQAALRQMAKALEQLAAENDRREQP